jgi:hypothetical protein
MRRRAATFFALILPVLAGLGSACHEDKPKAKTTTSESSAEPIPSDLVYNAFVEDTPKTQAAPSDGGAATPTDTGATAKLVDPGADPKSPLRYAFATKTRTVDTTIKIAAAGAGPGIPEQPPLHFVFTATPKPKSMMGGDATIDVKVSKFDLTLPPGTPPGAAQGKEQLEKSLVGVTGHFDVTRFGDIGDANFDASQVPPGGADIVNVLQQAFELLAVPVPNEAVGIGAKWEKSDSKRLADQGATVSLKTTITLTARDAHTATFKVENTGSGTMAVSDPRAPKGLQVARKSTATYTVVARLDGVAQKVDGQSTTDVTQKLPGQPDQTVTIKLTQNLTSK